MKASLLLVIHAVAFGLISGQESERRTCSCHTKLVDESGSISDIHAGEIFNASAFYDCDSPTTKQECRDQCDSALINFNDTSVWTSSIPFRTYGDFFCHFVVKQAPFQRLRLQSFYKLCVKNDWTKGNVLSPPLSCRNGEMVN
ncbi:Uncharacterised protein g4873 [Pycnogonum litorale]